MRKMLEIFLLLSQKLFKAFGTIFCLGKNKPSVAEWHTNDSEKNSFKDSAKK